MMVDMPLPVNGFRCLSLLLRPHMLLYDLRGTLGTDLSGIGLVGSLEEVLDALGDVGHVASQDLYAAEALEGNEMAGRRKAKAGSLYMPSKRPLPWLRQCGCD